MSMLCFVDMVLISGRQALGRDTLARSDPGAQKKHDGNGVPGRGTEGDGCDPIGRPGPGDSQQFSAEGDAFALPTSLCPAYGFRLLAM